MQTLLLNLLWVTISDKALTFVGLMFTEEKYTIFKRQGRKYRAPNFLSLSFLRNLKF